MYIEAGETTEQSRLFRPSGPSWPIPENREVIFADSKTGLNYLTTVIFDEELESRTFNSSTIIIGIDGYTPSEDGRSPRVASYGVYFGPSSPFNEFGPLPREELQTSLSAKAYAARKAIEIVEDDILLQQDITHVILKTNSAFLARSLAELIWKWEDNSWETASGESLHNRHTFLGLHDAINEAHQEGRFRTQFWHVHKKHNLEADDLAKRALKPERYSVALAQMQATVDVLRIQVDPEFEEPMARIYTNIEDLYLQHEEPWEKAVKYWMQAAPLDPDAQDLCRRLRISMKTRREGMFTGFELPIRRLIVTGHDRPRNFRTLFGPHWQAAIEDEWISIRTQLLSPPPELSYASRVGKMLDAGAPYVRLRPATKDEQMRIKILAVLSKSIKKTLKEKVLD